MRQLQWDAENPDKIWYKVLYKDPWSWNGYKTIKELEFSVLDPSEKHFKNMSFAYIG